MTAKKAKKILQVSNPTLYKYVKEGYIKAIKKPNGYWDFDDDSIFKYLNKTKKRFIVLYARVSTSKQKKDLENQINKIEKFIHNNGDTIDYTYKDIASGISFEKRKDFFKLLDLVIQGKVSKVYISYKDRLSRVGFDLFKYLFSYYGCEIIVMNQAGNVKQDSQEVFEEIVSLLHCYAMRMHSQRKNNKIEITKPN
jgi:predicted site-specific integrase-resolvase